jgi:hypothetical protein
VSDVTLVREVPEKDAAARLRTRQLLIAGLIWLALIAFFIRNEWPWANTFFSIATTAGLIGLIAAVTGRLLFATILATAQVIIVSLAALVKLKTMDMLVHAYDLFFYFRSWSTVTYLASSFPLYTYGLFAALVATLIAATLMFRFDGLRVSRIKSGLMAVVFLSIGVVALTSIGERRHMHLYYENRFLSTYYGSWPETIRTLMKGSLLEAAAKADGPPLAAFNTCATPGRKPHIILIHQESIVPLSHFKELDYDKSVDPFFKSFDGKLHKMRVETYGGASWLTEFSVLAGVSTHSFGTMRQFVQAFMEGKVRETLPQKLKHCGYRNVLFYPMMKNFVSNARFYESIDLKEIFDMKDQKAPTTNERDRFYYGNALDEIGRHLKSSDKPLFTFIQTMSGHWPYDSTFFPEEDVRGGPPDAHPELHEYMRRITLAARDYAWLKAELKRRFPQDSFVIVNYGDHQPSATRMLIGKPLDTEVEDIPLAADDPGFLTYYSVETQNWAAPALPKHKVVDVPYLGAILLKSAGLPLSDAYRERVRLMDECGGRYHRCANEKAILAFHRRLIDAGIMQSR